jgi:hypothetical protein
MNESLQERMEEARAIIAEGKQSHIQWRDHLAACPGCEECRRLGIDWSAAREDEWVAKYDALRRTLDDMDAAMTAAEREREEAAKKARIALHMATKAADQRTAAEQRERALRGALEHAANELRHAGYGLQHAGQQATANMCFHYAAGAEAALAPGEPEATA